MSSGKEANKPLSMLEKGMWFDFVENNARSQRVGYSKLNHRNWDYWDDVPKSPWASVVMTAISEALTLFSVSPYDLPGRIARSMVPPITHRFRIIHVDFLGPTIAVLILICLLAFGQAEKENDLSAERIIVCYCFVLPVITHIVLRCCQAAITFMQLLTLMGYSLYGPVFTLSVSLMIDKERSNTVFFLCLAVFGGLTTLRVALVLLASLRIPAARLLVCSSVALVQLLFVVWLHFTYLHPSFVFGRGGVIVND